MNIQLRDPNTIMKLSRLGSFHQSKLSFLRSFLSEFKDWDYKRDLFNLDQNGYGEAVYSFKKKNRVYSLVCFANEIKDEERSDSLYADKIIEVTGHIKEIMFLNNRNTIILNSNTENFGVICDVNPNQKRKIKQLKKHQKIRVKGICKGFLKDVILLNCSIDLIPNE